MNSTDQYQSHRKWHLLRVFTVRALKVPLKREYIEYPERSSDCTRCVEVIYAFVTSMQENNFFLFTTLTHISLASFCGTLENSAGPDLTQQNVASDQGPHCLHTECSIKI